MNNNNHQKQTAEDRSNLLSTSREEDQIQQPAVSVAARSVNNDDIQGSPSSSPIGVKKPTSKKKKKKKKPKSSLGDDENGGEKQTKSPKTKKKQEVIMRKDDENADEIDGIDGTNEVASLASPSKIKRKQKVESKEENLVTLMNNDDDDDDNDELSPTTKAKIGRKRKGGKNLSKEETRTGRLGEAEAYGVGKGRRPTIRKKKKSPQQTPPVAAAPEENLSREVRAGLDEAEDSAVDKGRRTTRRKKKSPQQTPGPAAEENLSSKKTTELEAYNSVEKGRRSTRRKKLTKESGAASPRTFRQNRMYVINSEDDDEDVDEEESTASDIPGAVHVRGMRVETRGSIRIGDDDDDGENNNVDAEEGNNNSNNLIVAELAQDESELRERIREELAAEEHAQRNMVSNEIVVATVDNKRTKFILFFIALVVLVVAVVITVVLVMREGETAETAAPSHAPTQSMSPTTTSRLEMARITLSPFIQDLTDTTNLTQHQEGALLWLLDNDAGLIAAEDSNGILERYSLAVLYFALNGDTWVRNEFWMTSQTVCEWENIICNEVLTVDYMDLDSNGLVGSIPSEIGNLVNLVYLSFGNLNYKLLISGCIDEWGRYDENKLTGRIPSEIGRLTSLERLSLYDNELTGTIPSEMGNLDSLTELDLAHNELSGSVPPEFISILEQLPVCYLGCNWRLTGIPDHCDDGCQW